jgi:hypothetical protein
MLVLTCLLAVALIAQGIIAIRTIASLNDAHASTLANFVKQSEAERASLLERIQRPEITPHRDTPPPSEEPLFVPLDDDAGQWDVLRTEAQRQALNGDH